MSGIFSDAEPKIYCALAGKNKDGSNADKLKWRIKDGSQEFFKDTIGPVKVVGITWRKSDKYPEHNHQFQVTVVPQGGGKNVIIQLSDGAGYTNSIINTLSTYPKGKLVKFRCSFGENKDRPANPYYNVYVLDVANNDTWMKPPIPKTEIPEVVYHQVGDKKIGDDVARKEYFRKLAESINARLQAGNIADQENAAVPSLTQTIYDTPVPPKKASFDDIPDSSGDDDLPF